MAASLSRIVDTLRRRYGSPRAPRWTDPWELILAESASYLVDDACRLAVFRTLKRRIGLRPEQLLDQSQSDLAAVIKDGGMRPPMRAEKLRKCARLAIDFFDGDVSGAVRGLPLAKARRALRRFPGIGEPGADRILLFARIHASLPLESNGLRALLRLGYGEESGGYAASYRSVQEDIAPQLRPDFDWLIDAHQLLRTHGMSLCRRSDPDCAQCPLRRSCPFAARTRPGVPA